MRIAVPAANGLLCMHFGHCQLFEIMDVDPEKKIIEGVEIVKAPPHQPGLLPGWIAQKNVDVVLAGGMGQRAQALFEEENVKVIVGCPAKKPEEVVQEYLDGKLECGSNVCDH